MQVKGKRILSVLTYYTLIGLALALAVGFLFALIFRDYPMWAEVIYFIWGGVVIATVIFDIVCTATNHMKFVSGIMVYVLSVLSIIVPVLLYLMNTTKLGLGMTFGPVFILITSLSLLTSLFLIAEFVVGEALIEHNTAATELKQRGVRQ